MKIEKLSQRVANRIAAGEVITEPLSVIKELLENSLDAKSKRIELDILGAGLEKISIIDDGIGIYYDDAPLVFERHATSKLRDIKDLYEISSMGFRGEALASVAAVSKITLQSRSQEELQGFEMLAYGGNTLRLQRIARDGGTRIDVEDLFYNTPVLGNFQKKKSQLESRITQFAGAFAIGNPHISLAYTVDHKRLFTTRGDGNPLGALLAVFGEDLLEHLLEFSFEQEGFRISGYQSALGYSLSHRRRQIFLVNGRLVENPELKEAVWTAYEGLLPARRHPVVILWIQTKLQGVDVNLHPRKEHVRLYHEKEILTPLQEALRRNLYQEKAVVRMTPASFPEPSQAEAEPIDFSHLRFEDLQAQEEQTLSRVHEPSADYDTLLGEMRFIGALAKSFLLYEGRQNLYIMDQHAAHEKVLYEQFLENFEAQTLRMQGLAAPLTIVLGAQEKQQWPKIEAALTRAAFEAELFGEDRLILRAIPHLFTLSQAKQFVEDFLSGSSEKERIPHEELILRACKAAIKAGDPLEELQASELIKQLRRAKDPMTCPHGRPIFITLTRSELEKRFART